MEFSTTTDAEAKASGSALELYAVILAIITSITLSLMQ